MQRFRVRQTKLPNGHALETLLSILRLWLYPKSHQFKALKYLFWRGQNKLNSFVFITKSTKVGNFRTDFFLFIPSIFNLLYPFLAVGYNLFTISSKPLVKFPFTKATIYILNEIFVAYRSGFSFTPNSNNFKQATIYQFLLNIYLFEQ